MRIKYLIILLFFITLVQDFCDAQTSLWRRNRREFIFGAGATNFLGELGGANQIGTYGIKDFDWPAVRPAFMVGYRYRLTRQMAIKTTLTYARIAGNDKFTTEPFRENRNLNFRSPVIELAEQYEYTIVRERPGHIYNLKGIRGWRYIQMTSYLFVGAGVMYFNPHGQYDGEWYALHPLHTEGEGLVPTRKNYSLVQVVIPFGIGFKFALSNNWSAGIEYGIRKTFTDYLDDVSKTYFDTLYLGQKEGPMAVKLANPSSYSLPAADGNPKFVTSPPSQRGDPTHKDSYMFGIISFYYKIPNGRFTLPKFRLKYIFE